MPPKIPWTGRRRFYALARYEAGHLRLIDSTACHTRLRAERLLSEHAGAVLLYITEYAPKEPNDAET